MVHDPQRTQTAPGGQAHDAEAGAGERIAKALARAGVASRREVERLIASGRVALNGQVLSTPAVKVRTGDVLTVDGQVVGEREPARLFRYHKPTGLVTTHRDPQGRPTVFDALPEGLPRLISVGRLDLNSEGLLLLTNDGGLARALELPSTGLVRRYRARARGRITQARLDRLREGITVEGVHYGAIEASLDKAKEDAHGSANVWITLTLAEGKNREVRRVLEALGLKVNRLIRLSYGPFALAALPGGELEEVGPRVIREQLAPFIAPENLPKGDRAQWRPRAPTPTRRRGSEAGLSSPHRSKAQPGPLRPSATSARRGEGESDRKPKAYKPGWAKPKRGRTAATPSGSPPKASRPAGPRGPKPSPAPRRSSGAHRPGPRPGGGKGRSG
jgi:23S rRNA pseudouridine2605 synthase